jgi:hypothetical protein
MCSLFHFRLTLYVEEGDQFVFCKALFQVAVAVIPGLEFFDEPGGEAGRGIVETGRYRLRPCGRDHVVGSLSHLPLLVWNVDPERLNGCRYVFFGGVDSAFGRVWLGIFQVIDF